MQQLAARCGARERRRACSRKSSRGSIRSSSVGARGRGAGRRGAGRRPRAFRRAVESRAAERTAHPAHREEVHDDSVAPAGIVVVRAAAERACCRRHRSPRCDRRARRRQGAACTTSMRPRRSSPPIRSTRARLSQVALRKGRRRRLSQHPARQRAVSRSSSHDLRTSPRHEAKDFEARRVRQAPTSKAACRSKRWPIAARTTLRFGPIKPVGLRHPRDRQYAVRGGAAAQRKREGTAFNLVGFQTRMTWPAQKASLRQAPRLGRTPSGCGWA